MLKVVLAASLGLCLLVSAPASAEPIFGTFSMQGLGPVQVGVGFIDWGTSGGAFGPANGDIAFTPGVSSGSFVVLDGTVGTVEDLNSVDHPTGVPFVEDNFITSVARPGWNFILEFIQPGGGTAAGCTTNVGDVCTPNVPGGSPFTITNLMGGGSSVALAVRGTVTDGSGDLPSEFIGSFTTQFADLNAAEILGLLATQGFVQASHSATFTATVIPEPASMLLLGTGLAAASFLRRRKKPSA